MPAFTLSHVLTCFEGTIRVRISFGRACYPETARLTAEMSSSIGECHLKEAVLICTRAKVGSSQLRYARLAAPLDDEHSPNQRIVCMRDTCNPSRTRPRCPCRVSLSVGCACVLPVGKRERWAVTYSLTTLLACQLSAAEDCSREGAHSAQGRALGRGWRTPPTERQKMVIIQAVRAVRSFSIDEQGQDTSNQVHLDGMGSE